MAEAKVDDAKYDLLELALPSPDAKQGEEDPELAEYIRRDVFLACRNTMSEYCLSKVMNKLGGRPVPCKRLSREDRQRLDDDLADIRSSFDGVVLAFPTPPDVVGPFADDTTITQPYHLQLYYENPERARTSTIVNYDGFLVTFTGHISALQLVDRTTGQLLSPINRRNGGGQTVRCCDKCVIL
jgi:hypothetical protein